MGDNVVTSARRHQELVGVLFLPQGAAADPIVMSAPEGMTIVRHDVGDYLVTFSPADPPTFAVFVGGGCTKAHASTAESWAVEVTEPDLTAGVLTFHVEHRYQDPITMAFACADAGPAATIAIGFGLILER